MMKKFMFFLSFIWLSVLAFTQTPQAFKYQAVARNLNGDPVINQEISVKISILSGSPEGTVEYCELHQTTTNNLGLINLEVGRGATVTGNFGMIAWGNNVSFLKTEIDLAGGDNFVFMGTSQLLSVPYSLFSDNGVPDGQNPGDMLYWNGTQWLKVNAGLNGQVLTFNDGVPVWGGIQLPILNTSGISNTTWCSVNCGGNIASDGGSHIIERGVCWSTSQNPTIADNYTSNGTGAGTFVSDITGLSLAITYYFRAFATNIVGTSYGDELSFTTHENNFVYWGAWLSSDLPYPITYEQLRDSITNEYIVESAILEPSEFGDNLTKPNVPFQNGSLNLIDGRNYFCWVAFPQANPIFPAFTKYSAPCTGLINITQGFYVDNIELMTGTSPNLVGYTLYLYNNSKSPMDITFFQ